MSVAVISATGQEQEGVKDEGAHQAEYNADAQDRDHSGEIDSRVQESEDREGAPVAAGEQTNREQPRESVELAPTGTRTTSPSGSPGVLMEDGRYTDGTNTKQSAEPNIAGSPVPGDEGADSRESESTDVPDNKVFSGEPQKEVPGTVYGVKAEPRRDKDEEQNSRD